MEEIRSFKEIESTIKNTYYNSVDNPVKNFMVPLLKRSKLYCRETYSFNAAIFSLLSEALVDMLKNNCQIQYIVGMEINEEHELAIEKGLEDEFGFIEKHLLNEFGNIEKFIEKLNSKYKKEQIKNRLDMLSLLISKGMLNIKVGIRYEHGKPLDPRWSKFHPKVMIFGDYENNIVVTTGSPNESEGGATRNEETFSVFKSWENGFEKWGNDHLNMFKEYWNNTSKNVKTIEISKLIESKILSKYNSRSKSKEEMINIEEDLNKLLDLEKKESIPEEPVIVNDKWIHQTKALNVFLEEKNGILEMATGTGKTRTAISILKELVKINKINGAIITTYGTDLLEQWYWELSDTLKDKFTLYRSFDKHHEEGDFLINQNNSILIISWNNLDRILGSLKKVNDKLIIVDEIHGLGSNSNIKKLKGMISPLEYKLGLSATPEREYDAEGNDFIEKEIGPVIFKFGLEDAIKKGILCEFDYIPLDFNLSPEDKGKLKAAHIRYNTKLKKGINPLQAHKELLMDLASVKKLSKNKIPIFESYLEDNRNILNRSIIFVETMEYGKLIQDLIINYTHDFHTYFGSDEKEKLEEFKLDKLDTLITCKKISQGVDIKSIQNIVLFTAPKAKIDTIQRIGRCLRINPLNPTKKAKVVDFIVSSYDPDKDESTDEKRKIWLTQVSSTRREMK